MSELRLRALSDWSQVEALADVWDDLLPATPHRNFFMSLGRLRLWWKHHGECLEPHILVFEAGEEVVGILPLVHCRRRRGVVRIHTIEILGGEDSDLATFPLPPGRPEALALVFDHLLALRTRWDVLWLSEIDRDAPETRAIEAEARSRGLAMESRPTAQCPHLPIDRPYEDLFRGLFDRKSRNKRSRALRHLMKHQGLEIHRFEPGTDLDALLDALTELERVSWKGQQQVGIFTPEAAAFHRDLIRHFLESGQCELWWITLDGRCVSYRVGFVWDGVYHDYQTSFDPTVARLSPSIGLLMLALERLCKQGIRRIDFGRGVLQYKLQWATALRTNCLLRIYNRTPRARALLALAGAKRHVRGAKTDALPPLPIPLKDPLPPPESGGGNESEEKSG